VHEAGSLAKALACGRRARSDLDLAMVDLDLPDGSGWRVILVLHALDPTLRFLVISGLEDTDPPKPLSPELRERVLFLDKPTCEHRLLVTAAYACRCVRQDRGLRDPSDAPFKPRIERRPKHEKLSLREAQAMRGCAQGLTNSEIAEQLGISFSTAVKYVGRGIGKLGVTSRHDVAAAIAHDRRAGKCR
jgi:DNA-binding NarL/FixJ family response regulator